MKMLATLLAIGPFYIEVLWYPKYDSFVNWMNWWLIHIINISLKEIEISAAHKCYFGIHDLYLYVAGIGVWFLKSYLGF